MDRQYLLRHICFWAGIMIIVLFLIFAFYIYQVHVVLGKERSMTTLEEVHATLNLSVEEINQVQEELERLAQQQAVLETITRHHSYSRVLQILAAVMGEETWLRELMIDSGRDEAEDEEEGTILALTGFSYSNEGLGDFISQISSEPIFREVVLKYAKETFVDRPDESNEPVKLVEFHIDCSM